MSKTKPSPNTPQDLFATAVFMAKRSIQLLDNIFAQIDERSKEDKTE